MAALTAIEAGRSLEESGKRGDTNGAAMRISPVGILNSNHTGNLKSLLEDVYHVCLPTHGSNQAISGASALAYGISVALKGENLDTIISATISGAKEGESYGYPVIGPSIVKRIELAVDISKKNPILVEAASEIYQIIGAGVAMAESVPAAIGLFHAAQGDPYETILAAVNMGGDCDTVASMAGALAGAYKGIQAFPKAWIDKVEKVNELHLDKLGDQLLAAIKWWNNERRHA
jgi:ADP-ribosylglycohydrolase